MSGSSASQITSTSSSLPIQNLNPSPVIEANGAVSHLPIYLLPSAAAVNNIALLPIQGVALQSYPPQPPYLPSYGNHLQGQPLFFPTLYHNPYYIPPFQPAIYVPVPALLASDPNRVAEPADLPQPPSQPQPQPQIRRESDFRFVVPVSVSTPPPEPKPSENRSSASTQSGQPQTVISRSLSAPDCTSSFKAIHDKIEIIRHQKFINNLIDKKSNTPPQNQPEASSSSQVRIKRSKSVESSLNNQLEPSDSQRISHTSRLTEAPQSQPQISTVSSSSSNSLSQREPLNLKNLKDLVCQICISTAQRPLYSAIVHFSITDNIIALLEYDRNVEEVQVFNKIYEDANSISRRPDSYFNPLTPGKVLNFINHLIQTVTALLGDQDCRDEQKLLALLNKLEAAKKQCEEYFAKKNTPNQ